jgi:hypothetical protein
MSSIQQMPRAERRAAEAYLRAENAKWPEALKLWPREQWPANAFSASVHAPVAMYRSKGFLVNVYDEPAPVFVRLTVSRISIKPNGDWQENITWEELQRLKREAGYGDYDAVEVYPADRDVVNVANMRHLWILPSSHLPFAWRKA